MTSGPVNSVQVNPVNYIGAYSSLGQQVLLCPVDLLGEFGDVTHDPAALH